MAYYSGEEDEVDIRFRRGRGPPAAPVRFVDPRARERLERLEARDRAAYYQAATGGLLLPNRAGPSAPRRSLSQGRSRQHQIPAAPPVIINNHIDNYYDEEVLEEDPRYHYGRQLVAAPQLQLQHHSRSRRRHSRHSSSHSRSSSSSYSSRHSHHHEHHELEKTRKELEKFKIKEKEAAEAHIRREEEELARLKAEQKRAKEAKERKEAEDKAIHEWHEKKAKEAKEKKEAEDRAIKEWQEREKARAAREKEEKDKIVAEFKKKEQEKAEREKKEKEEEEKRYKEKVEADMKKAGLTDAQIAAVLKKESKGKQIAVQERPTYTRMARRHISIETLRVHNIDFEFDVDPEFVIIKRWVPEYEQDFLWGHTRTLRETRHHHPHQHQPHLIAPPPHHHHPQLLPPPTPGVLMIDEESVGGRRHREERLEFVRKRKPSPSPLLKFFAGGR